MKKVVKVLSVIISLAIIISVLGGCGKRKLSREMGRYSYWVTVEGAISTTIKSYEEHLMHQELQKRTGIKIDFIHPVSGAAGSEAFQVLMASNDLPDMIEYNWKSYAGGPEKAIQDKVIISLNDYIKDYAPNYYSYMEGEKSKDYPLYKVQSTTIDGNYYGFRNLNIGTYRCFSGIYIRKDMLDKWGLEVPSTIDEWTNVLKVAKQNGVDKPLTGSAGLFAVNSNSNLFNSAWNVSKDFYIDGEIIKFSPDNPEYKNYVSKMAEWYKAGYVDPDYLTNDTETIQGNMTNGSSIATFGGVGGGMGKLFAAMSTRDEKYNLVACPTPVLKKGDTSWFVTSIQAESLDPTIAITVACGAGNEERYKEAMGFCDYLYSDEGLILKSFGVKGETFDTVEVKEQVVDSDGNTFADTRTKYVYTDKILNPDEYKKYNAQSIESAIYHFFRPANSPGFNQHDDYLDGYYPYEQQKDALVIWNEFYDEAKKHILPSTLPYKEEEINRMNEIKASNCTNNFDAAINDIIMCKKSLNDYESCVKKAKKEGYDELTKIHQAAYDRYLSAIK